MTHQILLLNCGSSSIKYQLLDPSKDAPDAVGIVQRIGIDGGTLDHEVGGESFHLDQHFADHSQAVAAVVAQFAQHGPSLDGVSAVGHRTVHGGTRFVESVLIDDVVIAGLTELFELAPLHNPPAVAGIRAAQYVLPNVPHVAIFDTAFFATLPAEAYTYAINRDVASRYGIRKFGFHGTSHKYVSAKAAEFLNRVGDPDLRVIVCHLGNGASISAVQGGAAVETSMGLTPLQGLVMGTRSGDVDPGLHKYLVGTGMTMGEVDILLNKQSGMAGMCGHADMRDVMSAIEEGDAHADLALDVYCHRLVTYIGAYTAILGGLDALVFTAGVGENSSPVRERVVTRLEALGYRLDHDANQQRSKQPREISAPESSVRVLVVPTNEELAMAQEIVAVLGA